MGIDLQALSADLPVTSKIIPLHKVSPSLRQYDSPGPGRRLGSQNLLVTWQQFYDKAMQQAGVVLVQRARYDRNMDVSGEKAKIAQFLKSISPLACTYSDPQSMNRLLQALIESWDSGEVEKLRTINRVNDIFEAQTDWSTWGQADYWASACETLEKGSGDCEQFAMLKYSLARAMGISKSNLRLGTVKTGNGENHMILFYFPTKLGNQPLPVNVQESYILDNRRPTLQRVVLSGYSYPRVFMSL
jgi:predicted transglutaminase-like cysteine proteinase